MPIGRTHVHMASTKTLDYTPELVIQVGGGLLLPFFIYPTIGDSF